MKKLRATRALISGGASGIGLAIAETLASQGVELVLVSRRLGLLEQEAARLQGRYGVRVLPLALDLCDGDQVRACHAEARERLGPIDLLVNNSGVGSDYLVQDLPESEWDRVMDTCAKGTFLLTQACLPDMLAHRHGTIINIASQAARHGYARASVYCAAKFAVLGFAKALREEVQHQGIRVHTLCPGLVQVPPPACPGERKPGWLQVEDLAEAVLYTLRQPAHVQLDEIGMTGI
ncbi:SDR family oxidoreductase [Aeromonas media]|uniref:SDR family oxidoreductase n=1 Tax=Aeromonas media TaxID=651 RepID=UPI002280E2DD|nr:SDR family oxidoreductase [Aeromonas media]MCY9838176.1 SDR family NAD(P)-dependent oxidoreductase [Aeromonas media]